MSRKLWIKLTKIIQMKLNSKNFLILLKQKKKATDDHLKIQQLLHFLKVSIKAYSFYNSIFNKLKDMINGQLGDGNI